MSRLLPSRRRRIPRWLMNWILERYTERDYNLHVEPTDHCVVGFPRSGSTWLLWLLYNLHAPHHQRAENPFGSVNQRVAVVETYHVGNPAIDRLRRSGKRIILKSHSVFRTKFTRSKVIYTIRDPRDIFISYLKYRRGFLSQPISTEDYSRSFLTTGLGSFGIWSEHVGSWLGAMAGRKSRFRVVRYEDMLREPGAHLTEICRFLGWECDSETISATVASCDFARLQQLERQRKGIDRADDVDTDRLFFRAGTSGQWQSECDDAVREQIESTFCYWMSELGYLEDPRRSSPADGVPGSGAPPC